MAQSFTTLGWKQVTGWNYLTADTYHNEFGHLVYGWDANGRLREVETREKPIRKIPIPRELEQVGSVKWTGNFPGL